MSDPKNPKPNDQVIDISDVVLTDTLNQEAKRLTKVRAGIGKAIAALVQADAAALKRAGVLADQVKEVVDLQASYDRLDAVEPAIERLYQLVKDTKKVRGHELATRIAELASLITRRANRSQNRGEVLGPFEDLLDYQYGPAKKANATKAKTKAEEAVKKASKKAAKKAAAKPSDA
jgi:hypothetical protein